MRGVHTDSGVEKAKTPRADKTRSGHRQKRHINSHTVGLVQPLGHSNRHRTRLVRLQKVFSSEACVTLRSRPL